MGYLFTDQLMEAKNVALDFAVYVWRFMMIIFSARSKKAFAATYALVNSIRQVMGQPDWNTIT